MEQVSSDTKRMNGGGVENVKWMGEWGWGGDKGGIREGRREG